MEHILEIILAVATAVVLLYFAGWALVLAIIYVLCALPKCLLPKSRLREALEAKAEEAREDLAWEFRYGIPEDLRSVECGLETVRNSVPRCHADFLGGIALLMMVFALMLVFANLLTFGLI